MATHLLRIVVANKEVVLYPGEKVKFLLKSPLFVYTQEASSRIINFTVPAEPNQNIFNYLNQKNRRIKIDPLDCSVYLGDTLFTLGKLDVTSFDNEKYEIRIRFDRGAYAEIGNKSLRDFKYQNPTSYRFSLETLPHLIFDLSFLAGIPPANYPVELRFNPYIDASTSYYVYPNYSTPTTLSNWITEIVDAINTQTEQYGLFATKSSATQFLVYDVFSVGSLPDVDLESTDIDFYSYIDVNKTNSGFLSIFLEEYVNAYKTILDPASYDYVYPTMFLDKGENDLKIISGPKWMNVFAPNDPWDISSGPLFNTTKTALMPQAFLYKVLNFIHAENDINLIDDFFDDELKNLLLFNPSAVASAEQYDITGPVIFTGTRSFLFSSILPNQTYSDLIYTLNNFFCCVFYFKSREKTLRIIARKDVINSESFIDFSSKLLYSFSVDNTRFKDGVAIRFDWPEDEELVENIPQEIYTYNRKDSVDFPSNLPIELSRKDDVRLAYVENNNYNYSQDKIWQLLGEGLEDRDDPKEIEKISLDQLGSTLFMASGPLEYRSPVNTFYVSLTCLKSFSHLWFNHKNNGNSKIRLMFYRGLQPCEYATTIGGEPTPGQYPLAQYHNYDFLNNKIGNYSLAINSNDGLYEVWWKDWIDFLKNSKEVKLTLNFSLTDLLQFDFFTKVQLYNNNYFFDEIEFTVDDKISISNVKAVQIKKSYE